MHADPPAGRRPSLMVIALALATIVTLVGVLTKPSPPSLSTQVTGDPALAARAQPLLQGALDRVSIATIDGDTVTYAHFGANENTEYEIGSITKTFTSLLLADAIARREVTAETKLGEILPLGGAAAADVRLAELASHRSGLPRLATLPRDQLTANLLAITHRDPYIQDAEGVIAQARAATLSNRGEVVYSNLGAALLGQALAVTSGVEYARLVQERIFEPLGMTASSVPITPQNLPADAPTGYNAAGKDEAPWTFNGWAPAGGIRSTPADMVRYARALLDGSAPGIDALTPRWEFDEQEVGYAWFTEQIDGQTVTWHDGRSGGFAGMIVLDRANDQAAIVLSNTSDSVDQAGVALVVGER